MRLLWFVLPDEFLILVIAVIAVGVMLRLITGRVAAGIVGGLLLCVLAEPFIEALTDALPLWLLLLLILGTALWVFRIAVESILGERAAGHFIGTLAVDAFRLFFRVLFSPFRLIGWLLRRT